MLQEVKKINIDKLNVWFDNPRHGLQTEQKEYSQVDVINILIDVVGEDKMFKLIEDIYNVKGLLKNIMPVVVCKDDKYYVYDGNRRISSLKILKNPSIVESESLKNRVIKLIGNSDVSFAENPMVYLTDDENEALDIMDKMHTGEQEGVGMIPWESYQRDVSLDRRGKSLQYPRAFKICQVLKYTTKTFTKDTLTYTDLNRLFGAKYLTDFFKIDENSEDFEAKIKKVISLLEKYKKELKFKSYSRQFNTTSEKESNGPIKEFCDWAKEQEDKARLYKFESNPIEIFEDQEFSFELIELKIFDANGKTVKFSFDDIEVKYISPKKKILGEINLSQDGEWILEIKYNNEIHNESVIVKKLCSPRIDFENQNNFPYGNSINLNDLVIRATDSHGQDCARKIKIKPLSKCDIENHTFTGSNPQGCYRIQYSIKDINGETFSTTKEINIVDKMNPLLPQNQNASLLSTRSDCTAINISPFVNELIREINNLDFEENVNVIAASLRAIVELTFDELQTRKIITFSYQNGKDLKVSLDNFIKYLDKAKLSELCKSQGDAFASFHTEENFLKIIDTVKVAAFLNLAAHKGGSRLETSEVREFATKKVVPILMYASALIDSSKRTANR